MQYLVYTHIWTYTIKLDYLVQMLDKVWVTCVQFSHLCMCDKINFPLYILPCVNGFRRFHIKPAYFIHSVREGIFTYVHMWRSRPPTCVYVDMPCVCARVWEHFSCSSNMSTFVCFLSFIFKWSCLCSTKDCNSFPEQGSCSVCIDLSYTVDVDVTLHGNKL